MTVYDPTISPENKKALSLPLLVAKAEKGLPILYQVKADVLDRGPFKILFDDYSASVIGNGQENTRTPIHKYFSQKSKRNAQKKHLRICSLQKAPLGSVKQGLGGTFTSITNYLATETGTRSTL